MKKFFMIAAMAVATVAANAQVWVGGNLNYQTSKANVEVAGVSTDKTSSSFSIAPEVGYDLDDNWSVAIALGYSYDPNHTINYNGNSVNGASNMFTINPYVRYKFVKAGDFTFFVDGGLNYATRHMNGTSDAMDNMKYVGVGFRPGIAYAISPKVGLVAHVGELGYAYGWTKIKTNPEIKLSENNFTFGLTNAISFGAYVNL